MNRIRYQVPEQNIILDFWGKIAPPSRRTGEKLKKRASPRKKRTAGNGYDSGNSSPLTDLSSSGEEDAGMADARPPRSRSLRATSTSVMNGLDNLALLAEVRYIDLLNEGDCQPASPRTSQLHAVSANAPVPSTSSANAVASTSLPPPPSSTADTTRFPIPSHVPLTPGSASVGTASPNVGSLPLAGTARRASPSLSPAPVASAASRGTTPQAELTVQSKEDLKALMQVRKLLLSQGQAQGSAKTTMMSFLEGAPIIPKLAFVNHNKATSWQRPWESKKDGPRPVGATLPPTPSATQIPASPVAPPAQTSDTLQKSVISSTASSSIKGEGGLENGNVQRPSTALPLKESRPASTTTPQVGGSPPAPPAPLPTATRPSHSPVLSSHHIPTPYSSDMPFQLPAFRPPSATPTPRSDSMPIDSTAHEAKDL